MKINSFSILLLSVFLCSCASIGRTKPYQDKGINIESLRQLTSKSCSSTNLLVVAKYWGIKKSIAEIEQELGARPKDGYTLGQLHNWAKKNGLEAFIFSGSIEDIVYHTKKRRPLIVCIEKGKRNHSVVVKFVTRDGNLVVMDPVRGGNVLLEREKFLKYWKPLGNPILLIAPARVETKDSRKNKFT